MEKFDRKPQIVDIPPKMVKKYGSGKMLIPSPRDIDEIIRSVGKGRLITQEQIREKLAEKYGVNITCPMTTGIFISKIIALMAEEKIRKGERDVTPYWRVVGKNGVLNPKFPGGVEMQARRLEEEGHKIIYDRKPRVKDYQKYLVNKFFTYI